MNRWLPGLFVSLLSCSSGLAAESKKLSEPPSVAESARGIPVAHQVDVVVVGGSTGAVAAATAAASAGARVFLAAPFPYLGEDMTATLRLWLEEGETPRAPLAKKLFAERREPHALADPDRLLEFTYEADRPSATVHPDTARPSRLADGEWGSATTQSVQYDGDVTLTLQLREREELESVNLMVYHRRDFQIGSMSVSKSNDGKEWTEVVTVPNEAPPQSGDTESALVLTAAVSGTPRYLRLSVRKAPTATRVLVGEIAVVKARKPGDTARPTRVPPARPLHVKKTLDDALLAAGVDYLYSCFATDVLHDEGGNPCGVVVANRAGRQAIVAKIIVDATDRAWVTRKAGARFRPFPAGVQKLKRVVVGGTPRGHEDLRTRVVAPPFRRQGRNYDCIEYTLEILVAGPGFASWARAEQLARDLTYHPDQQFTSDVLFHVPPDPVVGRSRGTAPWRGVEALDLGAFRPAGVPRVFLLGGCADIPRDQAARLLRPLALIDMGSRIGVAAAAEAASLPGLKGVRVRGGEFTPAVRGDVREVLIGVRPTQELARVPQEPRALPVLGAYDVVVIGGGTSGAPAGIGAARQGAKTLVVEYLHGLGGVGTQGAIANYYWGNRVGFSAEVGGGSTWVIEQKMEWWRRSLLDAGADIWFGAMGCGAFVAGDQVRGAVVATPEGRGVVLADVVIDATGNADVAHVAGAQCLYTDAVDIAMQGTGLPPRRLGARYTNTDFTIVDETDMVDVWHVFVYAKHKAGDAFDIGRLLDTRERRRIVGDFTISILDEINHRTYPDTVVVAYSDFDTHGYTVDPYFTLDHPPHRKGFRTHIPFRALLPRGLKGILVTGLGISAHRDAIPLIRMQADVQNQGYAAGFAAAMAAKEGIGLRSIDVRKLQKHLVEIGNLPESVLEQGDSYPFPLSRIQAAVDTAKDGYQGVGVLLAHPEKALPLLRQAYDKATSEEHRLIYAHILAVFGDDAGVPTLVAAVRSFPTWDKGWRYRGMGQFGPNMSRLDRLIYALGRTGDPRGTAPILEKVKLLKPEHAFSHFRAVVLALESIGDPAAAGPLAELVSQPGIRGHASSEIKDAIQRAKKWASWNATEPRSNAIRELLLARGLYRCGDRDNLGRTILQEYVKDLRGHLSRHAHAVLRQMD